MSAEVVELAPTQLERCCRCESEGNWTRSLSLTCRSTASPLHTAFEDSEPTGGGGTTPGHLRHGTSQDIYGTFQVAE